MSSLINICFKLQAKYSVLHLYLMLNDKHKEYNESQRKRF